MTHILNQHFDNIYLLYINQREYNKIKPKLTKRKISVQYFKGYNGLANKDKFDIYLKKHIEMKRKNKTIKLLTPGAFGHVNSMINILSDAIKKGYTKILILEPDIYFCDDFDNRIRQYMDMEYKLLYLGAYQHKFFGRETWSHIDKTYEAEMKQGYYRPYLTLGTFAVGIDGRIFVEYRDLLKQLNMTSDVYITKLQYKYRNECVVCYPNPICCDLTRSSTSVGKKQIPAMKNLRWNMINYDLSDYHKMKTIKNMKYELHITINSRYPNFFMHIISMPLIITIDKHNLHKYIKKTSDNIADIHVKFTAKNSKTILKLEDIFINKHQLISTGKMSIARNIYGKYI